MGLYFDGRLLASLRARRGWTIAELARRAGLNKTTITKYEQGNFKKRFRAETVKKIAEAFKEHGVTEIQFIRRDER